MPQDDNVFLPGGNLPRKTLNGKSVPPNRERNSPPKWVLGGGREVGEKLPSITTYLLLQAIQSHKDECRSSYKFTNNRDCTFCESMIHAKPNTTGPFEHPIGSEKSERHRSGKAKNALLLRSLYLSLILQSPNPNIPETSESPYYALREQGDPFYT